MNISCGLDILCDEKFSRLRGLSIGVVTHAAAVNNKLQHLLDLIYQAGGIRVKLILSPEHGLRSSAQDMVSVPSSNETFHGITVRSLYGNNVESLSPRIEDLEDLDLLLIDLQDVGTRYYTFVQTMAYCMKTASKIGIKVMVLDRPNPLGGSLWEGSPLFTSCRSFCGLAPVPQRHGLTIGEMALLYNQGLGDLPPISADLEIIPMTGWKRDLYFDELDMPWVFPSPNMPTIDTATIYPGTCLFEATNISEGRGTTKPFEVVGAPFINPTVWIKETLALPFSIKGVTLRPLEFEPQFHKWRGQTCGGVQIHVTDRQLFCPFRLGLALVASAFHTWPESFSWRKEAYEFIEDIPAIDLLYGNENFRSVLHDGDDLSSIEEEIMNYEENFSKDRQPFLLY